MNKDLLILLILKEYLSDKYLCKMISNLVIDSEMIETKKIHKFKYQDILFKIELLYPGYFKTAIFERFRFDYDYLGGDGYNIYNIHPLMNSGDLIKWDEEPPNKYYKCEDSNNHNGVKILNRLSNKNPDLVKRMYRKLLKYKDGSNKLSVWYDFENDMFLNF